jgi:hypothetical protein
MKEPTPVLPPALTAYHFVLRNPKLRADQRPRLVNYANNVEAKPVAFAGVVCPTAFIGGKRALAKTLVDLYTKLGWVDVTEAFRAEQQAAEEVAAAPDTAGAPMLPPGPESPSGEVKAPAEVEPPAQVQAAPKTPEEAPALVPVDTADEVRGPAQEERPPVLSEQPPEKPPEAGAELGGHRPPETASSMTLDLPASGRGVPPETPSRGRGGASRGSIKGGGKAKRTPDPAPAPAAAG